MLRQVYAVFVFLLSAVLRAYRFRAPPAAKRRAVRALRSETERRRRQKQIGIRLQYVEQA